MIATVLALLLGALASYTTPSYEVAVEQDVVYATADGYWSRAPQGEPKEVMKLMSEKQTPEPLELLASQYGWTLVRTADGKYGWGSGNLFREAKPDELATSSAPAVNPG